MNQEGYKDPTADLAVRQADRQPEHVRQVFKILQTAAGVSGFDVIGIRDRKTGREYRQEVRR